MPGITASAAEVTNISPHRFWILMNGQRSAQCATPGD